MRSPDRDPHPQDMRRLLPSISAHFNTFISTPRTKFQIISTISAHSETTFDPSITHPPKTLYILDSSFNPPTIAHLSLALSALSALTAHDVPSPAQNPRAKPHRLLLLFSTHNADKTPAPALFPHRLAMMVAAASDAAQLHAQRLRSQLGGPSDQPPPTPGNDDDGQDLHIDVGLTTEPYYHEKTRVIAESGAYGPETKHVHLVGWDTFVRVLDPKYYAGFSPPLSALEEYFGAGHGLRVTLRESGEGEEGDVAGQRGFLERLGTGEMEGIGARREWVREGGIEVVEPEEVGRGVSSTRVRRAVKEGEWGVVERWCTVSVADLIKGEHLYMEGEGVS